MQQRCSKLQFCASTAAIPVLILDLREPYVRMYDTPPTTNQRPGTTQRLTVVYTIKDKTGKQFTNANNPILSGALRVQSYSSDHTIFIRALSRSLRFPLTTRTHNSLHVAGVSMDAVLSAASQSSIFSVRTLHVRQIDHDTVYLLQIDHLDPDPPL